MFINNTTKRSIEDVAYGGYLFTVHPGVSMIWEQAGEHFATTYGNQGEGGAYPPPVLRAKRKDWKGQYADVKRFKIDFSRIPNRNDLLRLAEQYGVDKDLLTNFKTNEKIEGEEIAAAINALPVPDDVRFPEKFHAEETNDSDTGQ